MGCAALSHELLEHIAAAGATKNRDWKFSVGWSCTGREMDATQALPPRASTAGINQNGEPVDDTGGVLAYLRILLGMSGHGRGHARLPR